MTTDEYKSARSQLNLNVTDWIKKLGISIDTHKGYNCGRVKAQSPVANHIKTLLELDGIKKRIKDT